MPATLRVPTRLLPALLSAILLAAALPSTGGAEAEAETETEAAAANPGRLVIAHYYPWYDEHTWASGVASDLPLDLYASGDVATMQRHIEQAQGAGIDAFNVAWLGPGNPTDANLARMLPLAAARSFAVSLSVETDSPFLGSRHDLAAALRYAISTHTSRPGYLWFEGKPVIFFWRLRGIPLGGAASPMEAWRAVREEVDPDHETLWIGEGDQFDFLRVFDGIHPYSIAWSSNVARTLSTYGTRTRQQSAALGQPKLWVATVMPGYDDFGTGRADAFAKDRGGTAYYEETWEAALGSEPDWIIITSWNEWVEGSQIEPSHSYGDAYLHLTRRYSDRWKGLTEDS